MGDVDLDGVSKLTNYKKDNHMITTTPNGKTVTLISTRGANDDGEWLHAAGNNFAFYYKLDIWTEKQNNIMSTAFLAALDVPNLVKEAILTTSGTEVSEGAYTSDAEAMTKAMNSIPGMSQTSSGDNTLSGNGTVQQANEQMFNSLLAGVGGPVNPMRDYLNSTMAVNQGIFGANPSYRHYGTYMMLIALVPGLDIPVTTGLYAVSTSTSAAVLVKHKCKDDTTTFPYDVEYEQRGYLYKG
jgi:hypothetical protein